MFCARCHREFDEGRFCPYDGTKLLDAPDITLFTSRPTRRRGEVLGDRYTIRGYLGRGAMAKVYLAEDDHTHRPVAIKVLEPTHAGAQRTRERFLREAQAAAMIGHPNIVRVFDVGQRDDRSPYLVMEYLFGEPLGDWLRRDTTMDADLAVPVLRNAASALGAAHRTGIIHRDIKPDNIFLVGEPGDPYAVKVLDFGLAKNAAQSGLTVTGFAVGTVEYMSPEQVVSDDPDPRTDVYALGIVMFRTFTGALPFARIEDDTDILVQHLLVALPRPSLYRPDLDPRIEAIILKAARKHPDNRYPSMDHLIDDLDRLATDRPLLAETPLATPDDVYTPQGVFARRATAYFYRRLGVLPRPLQG
ncbi:serine/threonine-protein kinase [Chondromyces apiculatus]|uniref:Serine/threonine protein kinase n=1 Tax=Chondromyces apiculatus DSM 436 TaxID=1192034 RepID=A0A017TBQ3_9BACT|nr:serine/threonine-protein kinase [Chondromyces apiculatus]EYF06026.1 serine/threonine protein kinase [Chondromyces apiculatus DSM 436]